MIRWLPAKRSCRSEVQTRYTSHEKWNEIWKSCSFGAILTFWGLQSLALSSMCATLLLPRFTSPSYVHGRLVGRLFLWWGEWKEKWKIKQNKKFIFWQFASLSSLPSPSLLFYIFSHRQPHRADRKGPKKLSECRRTFDESLRRMKTTNIDRISNYPRSNFPIFHRWAHPTDAAFFAFTMTFPLTYVCSVKRNFIIIWE